MTETANTQPSLSLLETQILMILARRDLHGYAIAMELQRREPDGPRIFPTNLYRRLHDLVDRGLIERAGIELDERGRARKNFAITTGGRAALSDETARLESLVAELRSPAVSSPDAGTD